MKKNSLNFLLILMTIPFMAFTCEDREVYNHEYFTFINKSDDTIYVCQKSQMEIQTNDTLYECNSIEYRILPKDSCFFKPTNNYWETDFNVRNFIMYFVFPKLTSSYNSCKEAQEHQLKRYQLTIEDLDSMNWTIIYP